MLTDSASIGLLPRLTSCSESKEKAIHRNHFPALFAAAPLIVAALAGRAAAQIDSAALDLSTLSSPLLNFGSLPERFSLPPVRAAAEDRWQFTVAPLLWMASLDSKLTIEGNSVTASPSFSDIWSNLNYAAMGHLEARKGKWAIFSDLVWMQLEDDNLSGPLGISSIDVKLEEFVGSLQAGYEFLDVPVEKGNEKGPRLQLEAYAGVRYTNFWGELNSQNFPTVSDSADWWDPLIGLRSHLVVSPTLAFVARWDVGGWGVGCEHTWFVSGGIEWRAFESTTIGAGYAALYQDYDGSGNTEFKQTVQGPYIGLAFTL